MDTTDYATVTVDQNVNVDPATPVITWNNPADIVDGTALSSDATRRHRQCARHVCLHSRRRDRVARRSAASRWAYSSLRRTATITTQVGASANLNVDYGMAAKLAFIQQPTATASATFIAPAVTVAVEDSAGTTLPDDDSTVTLTLSSGMFVGGGTTVTAQAVNGIATFSSLSIANNGAVYTHRHRRQPGFGPFEHVHHWIDRFRQLQYGVDRFHRAVRHQPDRRARRHELELDATAGVGDPDGRHGRRRRSKSPAVSTDETAVYTPTTFNLSDGNPHTISLFLTAAAGLNGNDRNQLGFLTSSTAGLNGGFSFISARIYGNDSINFQYDNGDSSATTVGDAILPTGVSHGRLAATCLHRARNRLGQLHADGVAPRLRRHRARRFRPWSSRP